MQYGSVYAQMRLNHTHNDIHGGEKSEQLESTDSNGARWSASSQRYNQTPFWRLATACFQSALRILTCNLDVGSLERFFSMPQPTIGAHCALSSCNINDFLPIKCQCERLFCRAHILPDAHACPVAGSKNAHLNARSAEKLECCAYDTCKKPSLEAFLSATTRAESGRSKAACIRCKQAFCAE